MIDSTACGVPPDDTIEEFFHCLSKDESISIFDAAECFRNVDLVRLTAARIDAIAEALAADSSRQTDLESALPALGQLVLGTRSDVTVSISARKPSMSTFSLARPKVVTASPRSELHIIIEGRLGVWGTEIPEGHDGSTDVKPASWREFTAPSEIQVPASSLAFSVFPLEDCKILSISGRCASDWELNIEAQSGRVVSRSFASPSDSSLANVLKLAMHLENSKSVCAHASGALRHTNPRVRLTAMKTLLFSGTTTVHELTELMRSDSDAAIQRVCMQLRDAA